MTEAKEKRMETALSHEHIESNHAPLHQNGLMILPFYGADGEPALTDIKLAQTFRRIVYEKTANKTFHAEPIRDTRTFISFAKDKKHEMYFVVCDGDDAGFFWLKQFGPKSAFINYCFFKDYWGRKSLDISKACMDYIFSRKDCREDFALDVLLGLTPADNKLAVKFLIANGMKVLGKVPKVLYDCEKNKTVDGVFSYKLREGNGAFATLSLFSFF